MLRLGCEGGLAAAACPWCVQLLVAHLFLCWPRGYPCKSPAPRRLLQVPGKSLSASHWHSQCQQLTLGSQKVRMKGRWCHCGHSWCEYGVWGWGCMVSQAGPPAPPKVGTVTPLTEPGTGASGRGTNDHDPCTTWETSATPGAHRGEEHGLLRT